ncbi:MAG: hypothetical protein J6X88_04475 [Bacteroidales bacterium]|nr:hypothetical protein [Bacteroidales bacterium]
MADILNNLSPEGLLHLIEGQIEKIDTIGTDEMIRLRRDLEKDDSDPSQWFELGLALNQAAMNRDVLVMQREEMLHPGEEELHPDTSGSTPIYEEALRVFDKVLAMEPDYYGVQTQRGIVCGNLHRLEDAERCYLQALADDEEDFSAAYYLGLTYRDMGNEASARKYLALAHELNPDDDSLTNAQGESVER